MCRQWEPALPAGTASNQPHSSLQAHFWDGEPLQEPEVKACPTPAIASSVARRMLGEWQAAGEAGCHPGRAEP